MRGWAAMRSIDAPVLKAGSSRIVYSLGFLRQMKEGNRSIGVDKAMSRKMKKINIGFEVFDGDGIIKLHSDGDIDNDYQVSVFSLNIEEAKIVHSWLGQYFDEVESKDVGFTPVVVKGVGCE